MQGCVFCRIIEGKEPGYIVYQDEDVVVILDKYPINKGHMLVMPRRHYENIFEIPEETLCKVSKVAKMMAEASIKALGADGVRLLQNNGPSAGQVVFHFHVHVIPYYGGGYRKGRPELTREEAEEVVSKIRRYLEEPRG